MKRVVSMGNGVSQQEQAAQLEVSNNPSKGSAAREEHEENDDEQRFAAVMPAAAAEQQQPRRQGDDQQQQLEDEGAWHSPLRRDSSRHSVQQMHSDNQLLRHRSNAQEENAAVQQQQQDGRTADDEERQQRQQRKISTISATSAAAGASSSVALKTSNSSSSQFVSTSSASATVTVTATAVTVQSSTSVAAAAAAVEVRRVEAAALDRQESIAAANTASVTIAVEQRKPDTVAGSPKARQPSIVKISTEEDDARQQQQASAEREKASVATVAAAPLCVATLTAAEHDKQQQVKSPTNLGQWSPGSCHAAADDNSKRNGAASTLVTTIEDEDEFDERSEALTLTKRSLKTSNKAQVDDEAPKSCPFTFKHKGPAVLSDKMTAHFDGGLCFRIVDETGTWWFYNDTLEYEMHVEFKFGPTSEIQGLGDTKIVHLPSGHFLASLVVYPERTEPYIRGKPNGFSVTTRAKGLSDGFLLKEVAVMRARIDAELAMMKDFLAQHNKQKKSNNRVTAVDEEAIVTACLEKGVRYTDIVFPPQQSSLARPGKDSRSLKALPWKRPVDYLDEASHSRIRLFRGGVDPNDIDQGALGNCFFQAAVAAVAEFPDMVKAMFRHPAWPDQGRRERAIGVYRVTMNKHGWWVNVILDDYFPCTGSKPIYAKTQEDPCELWVSLIEKAYAKLHGSYASISGGDALLALQDLTGFPIDRFDTEWEDACKDKKNNGLDFFNQLVKYDSKGYLISLSTPGVDTSEYMGNDDATGGNSAADEDRFKKAGLVLGHSYSVLQVKAFPQHNLHLLAVRNPWGEKNSETGVGEWTGDWGDSSVTWQRYPDVRAAVNFEAADDGTFWMEWSDVKKFFDGGGVCFTHFNSIDYRMRGAFVNGLPLLSLSITVTRPIRAFVILSQRDERGTDESYAALLLTVCKGNKGGATHTAHLSSTTDADAPAEKYSFNYARDCALIYEFVPEHSPYLVVPRCFEPCELKDYTMGLIFRTDKADCFNSSNTAAHSDNNANGMEVKFVTLPSNCNVFKNHKTFPALSASDPYETDYQTKFSDGKFVTNRATHFVH